MPYFLELSNKSYKYTKLVQNPKYRGHNAFLFTKNKNSI